VGGFEVDVVCGVGNERDFVIYFKGFYYVFVFLSLMIILLVGCWCGRCRMWLVSLKLVIRWW